MPNVTGLHWIFCLFIFIFFHTGSLKSIIITRECNTRSSSLSLSFSFFPSFPFLFLFIYFL
ncbi:hypothetical protein EDC94DRAFT_627627 [Helicostylum pulchrum]|nr:hypothetical protein EDC94DRAFT_627627 [Helicostylum pulchrum]